MRHLEFVSFEHGGNRLFRKVNLHLSNYRTFYIHGSVHRDSMLIRSNEMQQYAGVYLLQNYSTYFGCLSHPSSGIHQTVTAASGTGHITCQSNKLPPAWPLGHAGGSLLL